MKKILAVLIALMLTALCCFAAVAEGTIDFSGYTLEELLTIRDDLTDEIASRPGGEKMVLGTGQYKIGEDLHFQICAERGQRRHQIGLLRV